MREEWMRPRDRNFADGVLADRKDAWLVIVGDTPASRLAKCSKTWQANHRPRGRQDLEGLKVHSGA